MFILPSRFSFSPQKEKKDGMEKNKKEASWMSRVTHDRHGSNTENTNGALTHRIPSNGAPQPDGALKNAARKKLLRYRQLYVDLSPPVVFIPVFP
jgi:hypothetical protein